MRDPETSDPNPPPLMIVRATFIPMLIVIINSLILWVLIGGVLGPFTFLALLVNGVIILVILSVYHKRLKTSKSAEVIDMQQMTNTDSANVEENSYSFVLKSSLLSIWVPCVVGSRQTPRLFLISTVVSLSAKLLMLGFVVIFICFNIKPYNNHFFLLCEQQSELERFNYSQICSFSNENFSFCFSFDDSEKIFQKFRICDPDELKIQLIILGAALFSSLLSLFSGYKSQPKTKLSQGSG